MAPKKTRKRRSSNAIRAFDPKNAYDFYTTFYPITEKFKANHPDLYKSVTHYKGIYYKTINLFLNTLEFKLDTLDSSLYWDKMDEDIIKTSRFNSVYKSLKGDDMVTKTTRNFLITLANIENIRKVINLYKVPKLYEVPILYRGFFDHDPFESGKLGETVTLSQILSTSLSPSTALSFQFCSTKGPCCLLRMRLDSNVKFIPAFMTHQETYENSEHEIIVEPFTECKLVAKKTARIPYEVASKCSYTNFNKDGKITVTVYDVQISKPKKEHLKKYERLLKTIEKDVKSVIQNTEVKLSISPPP